MREERTSRQGWGVTVMGPGAMVYLMHPACEAFPRWDCFVNPPPGMSGCMRKTPVCGHTLPVGGVRNMPSAKPGVVHVDRVDSGVRRTCRER